MEIKHRAFWFPGVLPDPRLLANRRGRQSHWAQRAGPTKAARQEARSLLLAEGPFERAVDGCYEVDWTAHYPEHRGAPDSDAIASALKPFMDAVVDVGLLRDDGPKTVRRVSYAVVGKSPKGTGLELVIRQVARL